MNEQGLDNNIAEKEVAVPELKPQAETIPSPVDFIDKLKSQGLDKQARAYQKAVEIATVVREAGGRALLVGGFVRDLYFGKVSKDIDLEVYGLTSEKLREILSTQGKNKEVGKAFGVFKIDLGKDIGMDIDVSLPRRDSKVGVGHPGFYVETDPNMTIADAARRRDFTINSILADPLTGEVFDPTGGLNDIKERRLRVTDSEKFGEDPLRVLRTLQFVGRLGLELDQKSETVVRDTIALPEFESLSKERIGEEWDKLLLRSNKPSLGLQLGMRLGVYEKLHPQLKKLTETLQDPLHHPEGDVWMHTLQVVDEAAQIVARERLDDSQARIIMLAAVCHDLGKATTTVRQGENYIAYGHEQAGVEPARGFLQSLAIDNKTRDKVLRLIAGHMRPTQLYIASRKDGGKVSAGAIRRLAQAIYPATIQELVLVAEADHLGRGPFTTPNSREELMIPVDSYPPREWLLTRARDLAVADCKPADLTQGTDWVNGFGFPPSKEIGTLIKLANDLRDDKNYSREQVFTSVEDAKTAAAAIETLKKLLA
jgi:tRNA nucleotidyltransferase (CCA-adding enzyme)